MSILITGATSGIGEELAKQLQGKGKLLLTGRNLPKLVSLKESLKGETAYLECDLSQSIDPLLDWIDQEKPTLIFNNAGFGLYGKFEDLSDNEIEQMIAVNCTALAKIARHATAMWSREKIEGTLVNISSTASFIPIPYGALYGATKAFVTHLTRSLNIENLDTGIHVLASCPGMVETDFARRAKRGKIAPFRKWQEKWITMTPQRVVKKILNQVKGKTAIQVIDERYKFLLFCNKIMPSSLTGRLVASNMKKRL